MLNCSLNLIGQGNPGGRFGANPAAATCPPGLRMDSARFLIAPPEHSSVCLHLSSARLHLEALCPRHCVSTWPWYFATPRTQPSPAPEAASDPWSIPDAVRPPRPFRLVRRDRSSDTIVIITPLYLDHLQFLSEATGSVPLDEAWKWRLLGLRMNSRQLRRSRRVPMARKSDGVATASPATPAMPGG